MLGYFQTSTSTYTSFEEGAILAVGDARDNSAFYLSDETVYLDYSSDEIVVKRNDVSGFVNRIMFLSDIRSSDNLAVGRSSYPAIFFVRGHGEDRGQVSVIRYSGPSPRWWSTVSTCDTSYNSGDGFAVGDVADDGSIDVIVGNHEDGAIDIYTSTGLDAYGEAVWERVAQFASVYEEGDFLAVGDVIGDSKDEVIVGDRDHDILNIYDGAGTLLLSDPLPLHGNDGLAVGDIRGDDKEEIIFADASEDMVYQYSCVGVGGSLELNHLDSFGLEYGPSDVLAAGDVSSRDKEDILVVRGRSEHNHLEGEQEAISVSGGGGSRDRNALDELINEGGEWAEKMDPNWTTDGYLLLVGDTSIIPTFSHGTDLHGIGYRRIPASDNDYASTDGEVYYPNLSVGRIIGDLNTRSAIKSSLDILRGDHVLDNSQAVVASGAREVFNSPGSVDFRLERDTITDELAGKGFTVTVLHDPNERELYHSGVTLYHLAGHGTRSTWNGRTISQMGGWVSPPLAVWTRPLIYASASLTGDYHGGTCLAEAFLRDGACAYIGATGQCYYPWTRWLATRFYDQLGPGETVGRALKQAKRNLIGTGRYSWDRRANGYTSEMFHLFGDPKLELTWSSPPASAMRMSSKSAAAPSTLQRDLPSSIQINVPDYTVRSVDGNDYVEIPQGAALLVPCKPEVPVYTVSIDWPSGSRVQDVVMTDMGSAATDTGLNIPTIVPDEAHSCDEYVPESTGPQGPGWWPDRRFDWRIVEEPGDATTLLITVYPFYYNSDSTDIRFYNTYSFNIESKATTVQILRFETDSLTYASDQTVRADLELLNSSSQPMELIVESVIKSHDSEVVAGMPLRMLSPVAGLASCSYHWDSNGYDADDYTWEIVVKDTVGDVLNKATCPFSLGIALAEIIKLGVAPECFTAGESVNIAASLSNNGETTISGTIVLDVQDMSGTQITRFQEDFNDLAPQNSTDFSTTWDSASISRGNCRILAYALHDGKATPARCFPETHPYANGDFDDSGTVNLTDLAMLTSHWHTNELSVDIAPPGGDCTVNFLDLALLAEHWLED